MPSPLHLLRDLAIGWKLGAATAGALGLLAGVAWFALDRLDAIAALQTDVAAASEAEQRVREGALAAADMRVVSAVLPFRQSIGSVKETLESADQRHRQARDSLTHSRAIVIDPADLALLDQAIAQMDASRDVVTRQAALRREMLIGRQKNLFQARPTFEGALKTVTEEVASGGAVLSGVEAVRQAGGAASTGDANRPGVKEIGAYQLAMSRVFSGAIMFMATANGTAANDVRDSAETAEKNMDALLSGDIPAAVRDDAQVVRTLGRGIGRAALALLDQTRQLDDLTTGEMEQTSLAARRAFDAVVASFAARMEAASQRARDGRDEARATMIRFIGGVALLLLISGLATTFAIAAPIRRLTRDVRAIADGETATPVRGTARRDETGRMAEAVERLRGVMRQTFVQAQMIQDVPVGVMTAGAASDHPIQYLNAEAARLMDGIRAHLPVPAASLIGQSLDLFARVAGASPLAAGPGAPPAHVRLNFGDETMHLRVSSLRDPHGAYMGPMVIWRRLTDEVRAAERFERGMGGIAHAIGEAAGGLHDAAGIMSEATAQSGQRAIAVTTASNAAAAHVAQAAAGAEQLARSVEEIARQVGVSTGIAARAVREAEDTDRSVSGLSEAAGKIGEVVALIGDIAARTNLLALNATIEAARAGEAGKGFAVVAGEVKTLATQTARATRDIADQIASMRDATSAAAAALRSIGETIQRMNAIALVIAGAVQQQGEAARDITQSVRSAAQGTAAVSGNIAVVTEAVTDTGQRARAVLESAAVLSGQAAVLKTEVSAFLEGMRAA